MNLITCCTFIEYILFFYGICVFVLTRGCNLYYYGYNWEWQDKTCDTLLYHIAIRMTGQHFILATWNT